MRFIWLGIATVLLITVSALDETGSTVRPVSRFAYVANDNDDTISILAIERQRLRPNGYVYAQKGSAPRHLVVTPSQRFLYATGATAGIFAYSVDSLAGALVPLAGSPFPAGAHSRLAMDPSGKFLLVINAKGLFSYAISTISGSLSLSSSIPQSGLVGAAVTKSSLVYATNSIANVIAAYSLDLNTGALTPVEESPVVTGLSPGQPAIDRQGHFLFVPNTGEASVSVYSINAKSGILREVSGSPFPAGHMPSSVATNRSGGFLYVGNVQDKTISQYAVDPLTGALNPIAGPFDTGSSGPYELTLSPDEPLLYVADHDSDELLSLGINRSGELFMESLVRVRGPATSIAVASGAGPISWIPTFAYECNAGSNDVWGYAVDPTTGELKSLAASPFSSGKAPSSIVGDVHGRQIFAANTGEHSISAFAASVNGTLVRVTGSPFDNGQTPWNLATDLDAHFVYASNPDSSTLSGFRVGHSGTLTKVLGSPFSDPGGMPQGLVVDPRGKVLYVANTGSDSIAAYRVDAASGGLTRISAVHAGSMPVALSVDYFGQYLYAANAGSGTISAFAIDGATGALTPLRLSPFSGVSAPSTIAVDPFGNRLYVPDRTPSAVVGYTIFRNTGGLKLLPTSPYLGVSAPTGLAFDLGSRFAYFTNGAGNSVSGYAINHQTGTLTPLLATPFAAGVSPSGLEVVSRPD